MPRRIAARSTQRGIGKTHVRRFRPSRLWRNARLRRRWSRAFRSASTVMKVIICVAVVLTLSPAINWIYQVIRKPSGCPFPLAEHSTRHRLKRGDSTHLCLGSTQRNVITPELLAAIARLAGIWKSGGAHVLALVMDIAALRGVPAGFERRRDVSDYRWNVCRSAALLHSTTTLLRRMGLGIVGDRAGSIACMRG